MNTEKQIINILLDDILDFVMDWLKITYSMIASSKMSCEELTQWLQDHVKKSKLKLDKKIAPRYATNITRGYFLPF